MKHKQNSHCFQHCGVKSIGYWKLKYTDALKCLDFFKRDPVDVENIVSKIEYVYNNCAKNVIENQESLLEYTKETIKVWNNYIL